jgi:putative endonuclease
MTVNHGVPGSSPGEGAKGRSRGLFSFKIMYYIYILYSETADKYYVGHSSDPWSRLVQHLSNSGDKFTGSYKDWKLEGVFEVSPNKGDADRVEKFIKRQKSRNLIERILDANFVGTGELAQLVRVPHVRD